MTDAGLDLNLASGQEAQDLEFVLRALIRLRADHDRRCAAALRDEDRRLGSCGTLDDPSCVGAQVGDWNDIGHCAHWRYLL